MNGSMIRAEAAFLTAPDAFASVLPELDRCDRLSTAWDDMAEALSRRDYAAFDQHKARFDANAA